MRICSTSFVIIALACGGAGCVPKAELIDRPAAYFDATEPMEVVIAAVNRNNHALPTLFSRFNFEAWVVDDKGKTRFVNGDDGTLLYRKPGEFRMVGTKPGVGRVFEAGTTIDRFWMIVEAPGESTMWWGHYKNIGKPCVEGIPIRPDALMEVLGLTDISDDLLAEPAPTMRFNNDADAYMFVWNMRSESKWIAQKEVWYDRKTKLPRLVNLFDRDGRIILNAYLSAHEAVKVDGVEPAPKVATVFRVFFPETGTKMSLKLIKPALQYKGLPNAKSIQFPTDPGVSNEIQIDAGCID